MHPRLWTLTALMLATGLTGCLSDDGDDPGDPPEGPQGPPTAATVHGVDGPLDVSVLTGRGETLSLGGQYLTGFDATEPTLGITSDGAIFMTAFQQDAGTAFISPTAIRSVDQGLTWEDVGPSIEQEDSTHPVTNDPYLWVDTVTDRVYLDDLVAGYCTILSWTDDGGETWTTNPYACGNPQANDHQTIVTSPPVSRPTLGYDNIVYLCFNQVSHYACSYSYDGGLTWTPQQAIDSGDDPEYAEEAGCSALAGHLAASPDGVVYLPGLACSTVSSPPVVRVTEDDGLTWEERPITTDERFFPRDGDHDVSVAVDEAGNVHADWITHAGKVVYAYSMDRGVTWSEPVDITAPGVTATEFNAIAAGGPGQVAFAYIGTTIDGGYKGKGLGNGGLDGDLVGQPYLPEWEGATWNAYIGFTTDAFEADPVFQSAPANDPVDPIARGLCGGTRCSGMNDFIDVRIDDEGRPWAAFVDVCTRTCILYPDEWSDRPEGFVATMREGPSLRGDGALPPLDAQPPQVDLLELAQEPRTGPGRPADVEGDGYRTWVGTETITRAEPADDAAGDSSAFFGESGVVRFYRHEAQNVLLEVVWEDGQQDIDAVLYTGGNPCGLGDEECESERAADRREDDGSTDDYYRRNTGGAPGSPDSPSTIVWDSDSMDALCDPACILQPTARTSYPVAEDIPYTTYLTAFDGAIPDGFTAVGS